MSIDIAVVPVAGLGTRLLPATKSQPKEMLPVGRKPVVQYVVEELTRVGHGAGPVRHRPGQGVDRKPLRSRTRELIQTLRETGKEELLAELEFERAAVQYFYTRQRQTLGLGHAVLCARSFVGNRPFVVALGDSIIGLHAESDVVRRMIALLRGAGRGGGHRLRGGAARRGAPVRHRGARQRRGRRLRDRRPGREAAARRRRRAPWRSPRATCCRRRSSRRSTTTPPGKGGEIQLTDAHPHR